MTPPKQKFQDDKFLFYGFDIRKSGKHYSVDKKEGNNWFFVARFSKRKEAVEYIETRITEIQEKAVFNTDVRSKHQANHCSPF